MSELFVENQEPIHTQKIMVNAELRFANYDEILKLVDKHILFTKELEENLKALAKLHLYQTTTLKQID